MKTLQHKRGTAAILTANNPVLNEGEIGIETDTKKFKIGDGSTAWANLSYAAASSVHTHSGADIISGTVADARLSANAQASMNLYLWANFR